jgi:hypothetical protein
MATLHGILAELGIESPDLHPERALPHTPEWTGDKEFMPVEGRSYEVVFGEPHFNGQDKYVLKKVRIDGPTPGDWFDLEAAKPLDRDLQACTVKAYRAIG